MNTSDAATAAKKMSQLMFWNKQNNNNNNNNSNNTNNKDSNNLNSNGSTTDGKKDKRNWLHTPEALINGHVVYLVKFFGNLPVEQAKGIEVVKDAIRKLQFAQQMKKAETGTQEKFKKVEITISVDGVAIQEPRTQKILHQFPLHNISYCADEKGVKKFFSFIAKNVKSVVNGSSSGNNSTGGSSSSNNEDTHECFVFISNKLASDITLTIGQAFDLAYRKYMSSSEKTDLSKAQQQIIDMEKTITIYRNRLRELSMKLPKSELDAMLFKLGIQDITDLPSSITGGNSVNSDGTTLTNGQCANDDKLLIDTISVNSNNSNSKNMSTTTTSSSAFAPIVPPRNNLPSQIMHKSNSQKMDELLLNSDSDSDFDPRAEETIMMDGSKTDANDIFGFEPTKNPYGGQQLFFNNNDNKLQNKNSNSTSSTGNMVSHHSFTNEMNITPPLLAPPPKTAAPRRTISTSSNSNNISGSLTNGNTDLFGSDPFDTSGANIFKGKLSSVSVDDFSLESLDPLRK